MFQKARLKLTAWYVLITVLISVAFSCALYIVLVREVRQFERFQRYRVTRGIQEGRFSSLPNGQYLVPAEFYDPSAVQETTHRIQVILFILNGSILVLSAVLCYLFAGHTLSPIQDMVEEQHRFVSDASHELRTPLTALRTTFEVALRNTHLTLKEAKELIKENLGDVENLQTLSEALLKLSSYQNNHTQMYFQTVNLGDVAQAAVKKLKPLAKKKNMDISEEITECQVEGIESQLSELVVILLDNAIKYSPRKTKVTVRLVCNQKVARLSISDEGAGILPTDLPHIFDRFYRTDKSRSKLHVAGYGLGLPIAKQIAETHHGRVEVETQINKGSTFSFIIPAKQT
jgi:two-component system sensor histidine kinase CiaH